MASIEHEPDAGGRRASLDEQADRHRALVGTDEPYQRLFRIRQAAWRERGPLPFVFAMGMTSAPYYAV